MINFIEKYQLNKKFDKPFPKKIKEINELLSSEYLESPYKIIKGDKAKTYLAVDKYNFDEFDQPIIYTCPSLNSAVSDIYRLICKEYPELVKINFSAKNNLRDRFPKKYHKMLDKILAMLFEVEPKFDVNCDFVPTNLVKQKYNIEKNDKCFAYIIHDGSAIYDELSYRSPNTENFLYKFLEQQNFELEPIYVWATSLTFKNLEYTAIT